jgi:signal transduction histidine kinase/HAMP domain-containing protein/type II secretory pathway pseudopilin PulG
MTLNKRLFLYFFGTFFLLTAAITFFQYQREKDFRTEQLDQLLSTYNNTIYKYIQENKNSLSSLDRIIKYFPDTTLRVTLIDLSGNVIYENSVKPGTTLENHGQRPEIIDATRKGTGTAIRLSATTNINYYYLAHKHEQFFVRTALPYNLSLSNMLQANTMFLYFMAFVLLIAVVILFFITKSFTNSIDRLWKFTDRAEKGEKIDTNIRFPKDELGDLSRNIVQLYRKMEEAKDEVNHEREKLSKHILISQEGLGFFSADKKEILSNRYFIQYASVLADSQFDSSEKIFELVEFVEINEFITESLQQENLTRKRIVIEKNGRVFNIRCIVFQDNTFEISINDITAQERENELKRQLTQNISHELKTPVSSIMGYMESILDNPDIAPERQRFYIERSFVQAQRLSGLLQDISILNKVDESKQLFDIEECDVAQTIEDVLNDVQLEIEDKSCTVNKNFTKPLLLKGNRSLLYSIFRNLTDNALSYAGTNLTLEINCYREDEYFYYFSFTDNGVGIPEEHLSKIFERFYRIDKGRSRKLGGTGLGLSIVKNAVHFHKGNISAKNTPTGGLSFIFSLRKF